MRSPRRKATQQPEPGTAAPSSLATAKESSQPVETAKAQRGKGVTHTATRALDRSNLRACGQSPRENDWISYPVSMTDFRQLRHRARRLFMRYRRLLAATLAAGSVVCLAEVVAPPPPESAAVVVASRDLPGGTELSSADVRLVRLPADAVPNAVLERPTQAVDRILAGPVRKGEPLTDRRLVGDALVDSYGPDMVATPVRIADPDVVRLLKVGDHIDVYAASARGGSGRSVVDNAPVVALPAPTEDTRTGGALVVLAVSSTEAANLASASAESVLAVSLRG